MRIEVPRQVLSPQELGPVHFIGIGGAGLSAIARLMAQQGVQVSGSDAAESAVLAALRSEGITCFVGHEADQLGDAQTVVASTAVREDNPEVVAALERGLRLWPRSAGLRSVMTGRRTVAVAGTHGKTTTTAMLTVALRGAGADPGFAIGAEVAALGTNARLGTDDVLVAEADESDGAFLEYSPEVGVVTNVDADHLDTWGSEEAYAEAFEQFVGTLGRCVVLGIDDPGAARLVPIAREAGLDVVTVGLGTSHGVPDVHGVDVVVSGSTTRLTARRRGHADLDLRLAVPGAHYAQDALLALATGLWLGRDPAGLARGLADHTGAKRRMELLGRAGGVRVVDSYAHHPTEIRADLDAARAIAGEDRLVVAFQPHLVSRTRLYGERMGAELSAADHVVLADLYLAREDPDPEVTSALVAGAVQGVPVVLGGPVDSLHEVLATELRPGDLLLTLGAGDITTVGPRVLDALRTRA
ncbi:UDP-N-acetylmuramate--L-alanine ligase [Aeromicrobium sp. CF4.19]|uniref:UDP-N-acetylmuramate--L-alanine ligase n=1 Tax=Aeromicrobium sp. CF4.19 TaxID=3373082 RepID=UPI003EE51425